MKLNQIERMASKFVDVYSDDLSYLAKSKLLLIVTFHVNDYKLDAEDSIPNNDHEMWCDAVRHLINEETNTIRYEIKDIVKTVKSSKVPSTSSKAPNQEGSKNNSPVVAVQGHSSEEAHDDSSLNSSTGEANNEGNSLPTSTENNSPPRSQSSSELQDQQSSQERKVVVHVLFAENYKCRRGSITIISFASPATRMFMVEYDHLDQLNNSGVVRRLISQLSNHFITFIERLREGKKPRAGKVCVSNI